MAGLHKLRLRKEVADTTHIKLVANCRNPKIMRQLHKAINRATNSPVSVITMRVYPRFNRSRTAIELGGILTFGLGDTINIKTISFICRNAPCARMRLRDQAHFFKSRHFTTNGGTRNAKKFGQHNTPHGGSNFSILFYNSTKNGYLTLCHTLHFTTFWHSLQLSARYL